MLYQSMANEKLACDTHFPLNVHQLNQPITNDFISANLGNYEYFIAAGLCYIVLTITSTTTITTTSPKTTLIHYIPQPHH